MTREIAFAAVAVPLLLFGTAISMQAQEPVLAHKGRVIIPESGIERLEDVGVRMHTTYQIFVPANRDEFAAYPNGYALPQGRRAVGIWASFPRLCL
jgi:hypothetical protein